MGEIASLAKTFHDYGIYALAAALLIAVVILYREVRGLEAARLSDAQQYHKEQTAILTKSIENDKDQTHALTALTDVIRSRPNV